MIRSRSRSRRGYSAAQKWLHWGMALLVAILAAVGLTMTRLGEGTVTGALYELHKSIGLIVLGLVTARMAVRLARGVPPPEPDIPAWQQRAARASHYGLYGLLVLVPLAGWTATSSCCGPVNLFWSVPMTLPSLARSRSRRRCSGSTTPLPSRCSDWWRSMWRAHCSTISFGATIP
jgi:cytochrome b561